MPASASIVGFFLRHRKDESVWGSIIAPALGGLGLLAGLILMIINYPTLTGTDLAWVNAMPLALPLAAIAGAVAAGRQGSAQASDEDHAAKPALLP